MPQGTRVSKSHLGGIRHSCAINNLSIGIMVWWGQKGTIITTSNWSTIIFWITHWIICVEGRCTASDPSTHNLRCQLPWIMLMSSFSKVLVTGCSTLKQKDPLPSFWICSIPVQHPFGLVQLPLAESVCHCIREREPSESSHGFLVHGYSLPAPHRVIAMWFPHASWDTTQLSCCLCESWKTRMPYLITLSSTKWIVLDASSREPSSLGHSPTRVGPPLVRMESMVMNDYPSCFLQQSPLQELGGGYPPFQVLNHCCW